MHIKLKLLSQDDIFIGLRLTVTKIVEDIKTYDTNKIYPKAYVLDFGFIFGNIEITIRSS